MHIKDSLSLKLFTCHRKKLLKESNKTNTKPNITRSITTY